MTTDFKMQSCKLLVFELQIKQYMSSKLQLDQSVSCELWVGHRSVSCKLYQSAHCFQSVNKLDKIKEMS